MTLQQTTSFFFLLLLLFQTPHGTALVMAIPQNKLQTYHPREQVAELVATDEEKLAEGKMVLKQLSDGRPVMVQDFKAPPQAVLRQVVDIPNYVGKVPKLKESELYHCRKNPDGTSTIRVKGVVNIFMGYTYTYYIDHTFDPTHGSLTWTLDNDKPSDFDGMVGLWRVQPHPHHPDTRSRVWYACDLKLKVPAPKMIMNMLTQLNRKQALEWSKRESELHPDLVLPEEFDPKEFFAHSDEKVPLEE